MWPFTSRHPPRALMQGADALPVIARAATDLTRTPAEIAALGIPIVPHIDATILRAIDTGGLLNMLDWHTRANVHCRLGWAVTVAGAAGRKLERFVRHPGLAGELIYLASRDGPAPIIWPSNAHALADIRYCAALDPVPA